MNLQHIIELKFGYLFKRFYINGDNFFNIQCSVVKYCKVGNVFVK